MTVVNPCPVCGGELTHGHHYPGATGHPVENGLPADSLRQFLAERDVVLCRTCLRPLTWETRTEPGFLPRQGWYDDARTDPLVCFKAADYRHVPLTDREWAYYEAGRASVLPPGGGESA